MEDHDSTAPPPNPPFLYFPNNTNRDQGFLNSFYPYFAACPAFEPYPTLGSALSGPSRGAETFRLRLDGSVEGFGEQEAQAFGWGDGGFGEYGGGEGSGNRGLTQTAVTREGGQGRGVRGCRRLPTRYNGDWPLLFVDGDLQVCV